MKSISIKFKIILAFSIMIFLVLILFFSVSLSVLNNVLNQKKENELIAAYNEIGSYFSKLEIDEITIGKKKLNDNIAYKMLSQTTIPYYILFTIYRTNKSNEKETLMTNDPFLPLLPSTTLNKNTSERYFSKNYFVDGDLNILYFCKLIEKKENCSLYVQTAMNLDQSETNDLLHKLILIFLLISIPLFIISWLIAVFFSKLFQRLQHDYDLERRFTSDVSHELKTPVAVILGHTEMLQRWGKEDAKVLNESLEAIHDETITMKKLIENLLTLARTDNKKYIAENPVKIIEIKLANFIDKNVNCIKPLAADVQFKIECEEKTYFECDETILSEVFRIIIDNALKYSKTPAIITIEASTNYITISDNGIGIAEKDLPHIFDRFYRADESRNRKTGGTGLGLSIAKNILSLCGCRINAQSTLGKGTTIIISR